MLRSRLSIASPILGAIFQQLKPRWGTEIPRRCVQRGSSITGNIAELDKFDLQEYMAAKVKRVNEALDEALPLRHPARLHDSMRYTLMAGTRRSLAIIALASCELVGGREDVAMPLACAAEMLISMSCIHDDLPCIDDADFRRHRPANHLAFGEGTALLAGDALHALAFEHVAARTTGVPAERVLRAVVELASAMGSQWLMAGQAMDIASEGQDVDMAMVDYIHKHKAGKFLEMVAAGGAIVGGGSDEEVERLRRYGNTLGLLIQVVDDIADVTKTPKETGKSVGRDELRGKATYTKLLGIDGAQDAALKLMAQAQEELSGFDSLRAAALYQFVPFVYTALK